MVTEIGKNIQIWKRQNKDEYCIEFYDNLITFLGSKGQFQISMNKKLLMELRDFLNAMKLKENIKL